MGKVTKIMLILNILAGGAGIYFGLMAIPGKISDLQKAKETSDATATTANSSASDAKKKLKDEQAKVSTLTAEKTNLSNQLAQLSGGAQSAQQAVLKANAEASAAKQAADTMKTQLDAAQIEANKVPGLQGQLADWTQLGGTPAEIRAQLKELADLKKKATTPKKPKTTEPKKPKAGQPIAIVISYDPGNDFYVLNGGSTNGIKLDDKFPVYRGAQIAGYIKVTRVTAVNAIAVIDKSRLSPLAPFKPQDKVMKLD